MFRRSSRLRDRGVATPPHAPRWTAEADYNMQRDSLLFSIPPELRDIIFRLTLAGYYDESRPYPPYAHYNRPGYRFPVLIHTALLRTCKRVYMETAQLLAILNEAVFWCGNGSPELGLSGEQRLESLSAVLADEDVYQPRLHLFTKQRWLEQAFVLFCKKASLRSKILVITIRHSDWWYWEQNDPLEMKKGWTESTEYLSQLEELWVELEAMERDKDQVGAADSIVAPEFTSCVDQEDRGRDEDLDVQAQEGEFENAGRLHFGDAMDRKNHVH
ncbi:hypothetical protein FISHEDRAFT_57183 [Fistulina hepatica ATCC 64428]|nr:hypothetical protein FISHEDRAFT_57183 [Fistulina hepatica ATCC 64428]